MENGQISHLMNELEISCLPKNLPEYIEVDMLEVHTGDSVHISDLVLPEGVTSIDLSHGEANDLAVAAVNEVREQVEVEPVESGEAVEGEEGAEGTDGADDSSGDEDKSE